MVVILEVRNLSFGYSKDRRVFHDISFSVDQGEVFCILGQNGVGKSTLIKSLATLISPDEGEILLGTTPIRTLPQKEVARNIGYIPQDHTPLFPYRVFDFILMGRTPYVQAYRVPGPEDMQVVEECMDRVGIGHLRDAIYTRISGGERQMVMLARVLAQRPKILLLDEPTSHLDIKNQMHFLDMVTDLSRESGISVVMATHEPDHVLQIADRVAMMKEGRFRFLGRPEEVITPESMQEVFEVPVRMFRIEDEGRSICVPLRCRGPAR